MNLNDYLALATLIFISKTLSDTASVFLASIALLMQILIQFKIY